MRLYIWSLVSLLIVGTAGAQRTDGRAADLEFRIADEPSCRTCSIAVRPVLRIGESDGPAMLESDRYRAVRDSKNRYLLFATDDDLAVVKVFASDGQYLTEFGRAGDGPGEYRQVTAVAISASREVWVYDRRSWRVTILSPEYEVIGTTRLSMRPGFTAALFDDGYSIIAANIRTPERAGWPLHLVAPDGQIVDSFGAESGALMPGTTMGRRIVKASGGEGTDAVWSVSPREYVVERWTRGGARSARLERVGGSFALDPGDRSDPLLPPPAIAALHQSADGLLWVFMQVADPRWKDQVEYDEDDRHGGRFVGNPRKYRDSVIEVIDPSTGTLLARARLDEHNLRPIGDGLIGGTAEDGSDLRFVVSELALKR